MTEVTFLLSKDPVTEHGGDVALSRVVMGLARDSFDVKSICLSSDEGPSPDPSSTRVWKPPVNLKSYVLPSIRQRKSIVHVRYDVDELVDAINASNSDVYVAEHSYMAEAYMRSSKAAPFSISTHIPESQIWKSTRGTLGKIEAPRILRDELRVARAARAVGTFDKEEAEFYRSHGVSSARWIDLTLEPAPQLDLSDTARRLVFMGTRDFPPNQEAFEIALKHWPAISDGIEGAELYIIGAKKPGLPDPVYPAGVVDLGFVDDLQAFLGTCRAMMAPVATGGGVRVKILDAASKGLPVVGTSAAVGSLDEIFELPTFDDPSAFIQECRRYLLDRSVSVKAGERLYDLNAGRWNDRLPHTSVNNLIAARGM